MNIVCVICSDLLIPSDDIFHTPCGHIFHFVCLTQWLERSKSCPQCREKCTGNNIHRIYFNFSNNDTITEDTSSLQDKIDKLNFQLLLRDKDIKHYKEKNEVLLKQTTGLRKENKKVETEIREKENAIHALKEQIKYFKQQCSEVESIKQEVERLKKKVEDYRNIQTLLDSPAEDVDEMISRQCDPTTLITYISVMKREMTISLNKRRELRTKVKSLQQELTKVSMERNFLSEEHEKRKKLEEELIVCESEKMFLQNKLRDLEKNPPLPKKSNNSNPKEIDKPIDHNAKDIPKQHEAKSATFDINTDKRNVKKKEEQNASIMIVKENEDNSPYLPVKSQGVFAFKETVQRRGAVKLGSSILAKKSRLEQSSTTRAAVNMLTYDGFGGHSKYDQFPSPAPSARIRKLKEDPTKLKKQKLDTGDNQKLGDFVINLT